MIAVLLMIALAGLETRPVQRNPCEPTPGNVFSGWDVALVRIPPSALSAIPISISRWMELRGYSVPQSYCDSTAHNFFVGSLARDGTRDWAVLCSRADSSRIVVFWNGSVDSLTQLPMISDKAFSFVCQGREVGYSRLILPMAAEDIAAHNPRSPDSLVIDHQGLQDYVCEKGSLVFYWSNGTRHELAGAD